MDSWIKTRPIVSCTRQSPSFNPCFNGFMDKDAAAATRGAITSSCFNPCFNGFMDKYKIAERLTTRLYKVSILVLMDSWIKTIVQRYTTSLNLSFQSLF